MKKLLLFIIMTGQFYQLFAVSQPLINPTHTYVAGMNSTINFPSYNSRLTTLPIAQYPQAPPTTFQKKEYNHLQTTKIESFVVLERPHPMADPKNIDASKDTIIKTVKDKDTMRAITLNQFGGIENLTISNITIPTPQQNEILVHVKAISISPHIYPMMKPYLFPCLD